MANALSFLVPTFAVLLGVLLTRQDSHSLRADINSLRAEMIQLRKDIHREMSAFRDAIHRDMIGVHERLSAVESKQSS